MTQQQCPTFGGMIPPAPLSPYASSGGMIRVRLPPSCRYRVIRFHSPLTDSNSSTSGLLAV